MSKKIKRISAVLVVAIVIGGWGGYLISCTLDPSAEAPGSKPAELPKGMPETPSIYEPTITFAGNTFVITYKVEKLDKAAWAANLPKITYEVQSDAGTLSKAGTQSIEALIWRYGTSSVGLLTPEPTEDNVIEEGTFSIINSKNATPFVIIPLNTELVKSYLQRSSAPGTLPNVSTVASVMWIEDNPYGIKLELDAGSAATASAPPGVGTTGWGAGTYVSREEGIRITGYKEVTPGTVGVVGNVGNFYEVDTDGTYGMRSIATVLVDGGESRIDFYTDTVVNSLIDETEGTLSLTAATTKAWVGSNSANVRVIYKWADKEKGAE